jgi:hypothetical protein
MASATDLAHWAWECLVNRRDVWGAYWQLDRREKGKSWTAPAKRDRGKVLLTPAILARHFRGDRPEHVIGLHTTSPENTSRWGAVEVDWHGPTSTHPAVNLAAALAWYDRLRRLGFAALLTDSNGAGGYHLRVLFAESVPTPIVFAFLRWLTADHARHGFPSQPETFPKQANIDAGRYGNWLRLPGRHHTHEHWSRVWDGTRWLEGVRAVEFILALRGDSPSLIPADLPVPQRRHAEPAPGTARRVLSAGSGGKPGDMVRRIAGYMRRLPTNLGEGEHRDDVAFKFGAFLVRDLGLSDEVALLWLKEWDGRNRCRKGEGRLKEILANVHQYARNARGSGLDRPASAPRRGKHRLTHVRFVVEV